MKTVAESVEKNLKSYSEVVSSPQRVQPQFTSASLKWVFRDAVQEKGASANLIGFWVIGRVGEDLETKVVDIFGELEEKPRIVEASHLGKPSETDRPVKVVLSRPDAADSITRRSYS